MTPTPISEVLERAQTICGWNERTDSSVAAIRTTDLRALLSYARKAAEVVERAREVGSQDLPDWAEHSYVPTKSLRALSQALASLEEGGSVQSQPEGAAPEAERSYEVVERVARAIDPRAWEWLDSASPEHPARKPTIMVQLRQANAAIAAMGSAGASSSGAQDVMPERRDGE